MTRAALLLALALPLAAQQPGTFAPVTVPRPSHLWTVSAVALGAGFAADAATSWGKCEQTPFLRGPDGRYGGKGLAVTGAIAAGVLGVEWLVMRRWPRTRGLFVGLNLGGAGVEVVQAARNGRVNK